MISLAVFSLGWDVIFETRDEGFLLSLGARVADGDWPHRDFLDIYGPGVHGMTGAALALGDGQVLAVHRMLAIWKAAAVVLTFATLRLVTGWPWALFGALGAVVFWGRPAWNLNTPYASLFTIPLCQLGLWLLVSAERRGSPGLRFASGLAVGASVLFKQSLAILAGYGLWLSVLGVGWIAAGSQESDAPRDAWRRTTLGLWIALAALPLVPFLSHLDVRSYLHHWLPIHVAMAAVAWRAMDARPGGDSPVALLRRSVPWLAGAALVPALAVATYAVNGGLGALFFDMFGLPRMLVNYAKPAVLPSPPTAAALALAVAVVAGGVWALGRGRRQLEVAAVVMMGGVCLLFALSGAHALAGVWRNGQLEVEGVQLAAIGWAALATFAWPLARRRRPAGQPPDALLVPILFFHLFLCFQGFPRSGPDVQLTQGAQMILWSLLLPAWWARAVPAGSGAAARAAALALLLSLPLWTLWPVVDRLVASTSASMRELRFEATRGLRLERSAIGIFHIDDLELLVGHLAERDDGSAPIVVMGNDEAIGFLSGRRSLFDDRLALVFWTGWEMTSPELRARIDQADLIRRLEARPETVVIDVSDRAGRAISRGFPELRSHLDAHYEVDVRFGPYRVLKRRD